jgi:hypothetical protein
MTKNDRHASVDATPLQASSLIGSYFHSDAERGWQGVVVAEPHDGIYLVETFSWISGESHVQRLVKIDDMLEWRLYDTAEWMNNSRAPG